MVIVQFDKQPLVVYSSEKSCGARAKRAGAYRHILLLVHLKSLAGLLALGLCAGASAFSLGDLKVRSVIGSAFEAVLPFSANADEVLSPQCIRGHDDAASGNQHVPLLANVRFEVRQSAGGGEIVIRTRALVQEPAVRIRLTVDCGPKMLLVREYVVLLDAPSANPSTGVEAVSAPAPATAVVPPPSMPMRVRRSEPRVARAAAAQSASDAGGAGTTLRTLPSLRLTPQADRPARESTRPAAGKPVGGKAAPGYRLTLSQPLAADAGEPPHQPLKRSDELMSLVTPMRALGAGEADSLRAEARLRLSDNPFADALQMQTRLLALEGGMGLLRKELGEIESARRAADDRARGLAAENRRLAAWLNGAAMLLAFLLCAGLGAFLFWRYRLVSEQRGRREQSWPEIPASSPATTRVEPQTEADADVSYQQWRSAPPEPAAPEPTDYQRTVVLDRRDEIAALAEAKLGHSRAAAPGAQPVSAAKSLPAVEMTAPPVTLTSGSSTLPRAVANSPASPASAAASGTALRQPNAEVVAAVEYLPESALLAHGSGAGDVAAPGATRIPTVPEMILVGTGAPGAVVAAKSVTGAMATRDQAMAVDFSVDDSLPSGLASGEDAVARARSAQYFAEFERKLFPEIALGRVKLDDSRSIIGLARTYYQEDFDPDKAISFLEYALYRSSDPMRIHLALLEILRLERRVAEYAMVARTFHGQYPDSGTHWQLVAAYGRLLDPHEPTYEGEKVPGLDLDTPSNWLGSTLDMTKYVLGQKVADSVRDLPAPSQGKAA